MNGSKRIVQVVGAGSLLATASISAAIAKEISALQEAGHISSDERLTEVEIGHIDHFQFITSPPIDVAKTRPKKSQFATMKNRIIGDGRNISAADAQRMAQAQAKRDRKNAKRAKDCAK